MNKCVNEDCQYFREHGECSEVCINQGIKKVVTNADYIRNMPDEELVKLIRTRPCNVCSYQYKPCYRYKCEDGILKWLREEVKQ